MTENGTEPTRMSLAVETRKRINERLRNLAPELEQDIAVLDAQLEELAAARDELIAAKREAISMLRLADPEKYKTTKPGPKKKGTTEGMFHGQPVEERTREIADRIEAILRESAKPGNADGFITRNWLAAEVHASMDSVTPAVELLVTDGVLRADRKVRGGGMAYRLVR